MNNRKILEELAYIKKQRGQRVATIGMTARISDDFSILPRRGACGFQAINFLVSNEQAARDCLQLLDGHVDYLFIDVEAKKNLPLLAVAQTVIKHTTLRPYKPNDATLEAADLFILHHFHHFLHGKRLLIYGAGNIGSKLALRLAERGAEVSLYSRNHEKTKRIASAINEILPKYAKPSVIPLNTFPFFDYFDGVISFISANEIIDQTLIPHLKEKALVLDGGINNFSHSFYVEKERKNLVCYRLDVRLGFSYILLSLLNNVTGFFDSYLGRKELNGVIIVSGGMIGEKDDIVVDRLNHPTQVIGIANGLGGLKDQAEYTEENERDILKVESMIETEMGERHDESK